MGLLFKAMPCHSKASTAACANDKNSGHESSVSDHDDFEGIDSDDNDAAESLESLQKFYTVFLHPNKQKEPKYTKKRSCVSSPIEIEELESGIEEVSAPPDPDGGNTDPIVELDIDIHDFSIGQLEKDITRGIERSEDKNTIEDESISEKVTVPEDTESLMVIPESSVVIEARELLAEAENEDNEHLNIFDIANTQLKEIKKLKDISATHCIKMMMHLTAVIQYHLPPSKQGAKHGQYTLLDNEAVLHKVCTYLATQNLGAITLWELCQHANEVILPALGFLGKGGGISERMATNWLKKLGYKCKEVSKGIYHDGHERPDIVEA
ncbi:hypothetical protein BJV78DRAFT_1157507 [Lactifluus subvellereus]|nr:hypothetical protein BJV78DRAFT_1157507 [Lactifluus subvellereus]